MHIVLGISATSDEVTAALVDVELPRLGPVDERTTPMQTGSPAEVAAAVAASIGVMRLRAARADLLLDGAAVALESPSLREPVESALHDGHIRDVLLVDDVDVEVDETFDPAVAVAVWADRNSDDAITGPIPVVLPDPVDSPIQETRRGFAVVGAGIAAAVLAGSFAVWAVTGARAPEAAGAAEPLSTSTTESADASTGAAVSGSAAPVDTSPTSVPAPVRRGSPTDAITGARPGVIVQNGVVVPAQPVPGAVMTGPGTPSAPSTSSGGSGSGRSTTGGSPSRTTGGTTGGTTSGGSSGGGTTSGGGTSGGSTPTDQPTDPDTPDPPTDPGTDPPTDPGIDAPGEPGIEPGE